MQESQGDLPGPLLDIDDSDASPKPCNSRYTLTTLPAAAVESELEAVRAFLAEYADSPRTLRGYRKESERLLLWALLERGKTLAELQPADLSAYVDFARDPQPAERWCGPRMPRNSGHWRPFVGGLSDSGIQTMLGALRSMFGFLVESGYLATNPLATARRIRRQARKARQMQAAESGVERFLDADMRAALLQAVEGLPDRTDREYDTRERAHFLVAILLMLAPRASELAAHTMGSFREIRGRWWWYVVGKGDKPARIPVPDDLLAALARYRRHYGLKPLPDPDDETPLLLSLDGRRGIRTRQLTNIMRRLFNAAATVLDVEQPHKAERMRKATTHWLRHTAITDKIDAGMGLRYVQRDARHSDPRTTALYTHEDEERWHGEAQKHRLRR